MFVYGSFMHREKKESHKVAKCERQMIYSICKYADYIVWNREPRSPNIVNTCGFPYECHNFLVAYMSHITNSFQNRDEKRSQCEAISILE